MGVPSTGVALGDVFIPAYTGAPADAHGVQWKLTQLDGWDDGWESNGATVEQRSQADGAWLSPQYAGARVVHAGGSLVAGSWDAATVAWDRLLAQIPFRALATMTVSRGEGTIPTLTALVRQHEKPVVTRHAGRVGFSLSLIAPDPRRYATTVQSVGLVLPLSSGGLSFPISFPISFPVSSTVSQATLTNDGNVTTYPTLTVTGPCPPCTITNVTTSEALRVVDAVPTGQSLVIDVQAGTAVTGGQARRVLGTWWGLEPGANQVAFTADSYDAGAALQVAFRSAWK